MKIPKELRFRPIDNTKLASRQNPGELSYSVMEGYDFQWVSEGIYNQLLKWYGSIKKHHFPRKVIRENSELIIELHPMRFVVFDADNYLSSPSSFESPSKSNALKGKGRLQYFSRHDTIKQVTHVLAEQFRKKKAQTSLLSTGEKNSKEDEGEEGPINSRTAGQFSLAEHEIENNVEEEENRFRIWVGPVPPYFSIEDCSLSNTAAGDTRPQDDPIKDTILRRSSSSGESTGTPEREKSDDGTAAGAAGSPPRRSLVTLNLSERSAPLSPCSPKLTACNIPLQLQEDYTGFSDPFVLLQPTQQRKESSTTKMRRSHEQKEETSMTMEDVMEMLIEKGKIKGGDMKALTICLLLDRCEDPSADPMTDRNAWIKYEIDPKLWRKYLKPGSWVDARDTRGTWIEGRIDSIVPYKKVQNHINGDDTIDEIVLAEEDKQTLENYNAEEFDPHPKDVISVRFTGWSSTFNEDFLRSSDDLAKVYTHTPRWRDFQVRDCVEVRMTPEDSDGEDTWHRGEVISIGSASGSEEKAGMLQIKYIQGSKREIRTQTVWLNPFSDRIAPPHTHYEHRKGLSETVVRNKSSFSSFNNSNLQGGSYGRGQRNSSSSFSSSQTSRSSTGSFSSFSLTQNRHLPGVCGLQNIGNTCFMNSILQCLFASKPLTDYMLKNRWKNDVNAQNPLGLGGQLAAAYAELLSSIWSGQHSSVAPRDLKSTIGRFRAQFRGTNQEDAQELLNFLLDGIHEDLNRVKKKPYVESKDANGRKDAIVAKEAWEDFLKRNKSVVVDLFYGLLRSHLTCSLCQFESIKFDPFSLISVPIPSKDVLRLFVEVVFRDQRYPVFFGLDVPKDGCILDLKRLICKSINKSQKNESGDDDSEDDDTEGEDDSGGDLDLEHQDMQAKKDGKFCSDRFVCCDIYNNKVWQVLSNSEKLSDQKKNTLVMYEVELANELELRTLAEEKLEKEAKEKSSSSSSSLSAWRTIITGSSSTSSSSTGSEDANGTDDDDEKGKTVGDKVETEIQKIMSKVKKDKTLVLASLQPQEQIRDMQTSVTSARNVDHPAMLSGYKSSLTCNDVHLMIWHRYKSHLHSSWWRAQGDDAFRFYQRKILKQASKPYPWFPTNVTSFDEKKKVLKKLLSFEDEAKSCDTTGEAKGEEDETGDNDQKQRDEETKIQQKQKVKKTAGAKGTNNGMPTTTKANGSQHSSPKLAPLQGIEARLFAKRPWYAFISNNTGDGHVLSSSRGARRRHGSRYRHDDDISGTSTTPDEDDDKQRDDKIFTIRDKNLLLPENDSLVIEKLEDVGNIKAPRPGQGVDETPSLFAIVIEFGYQDQTTAYGGEVMEGEDEGTVNVYCPFGETRRLSPEIPTIPFNWKMWTTQEVNDCKQAARRRGEKTQRSAANVTNGISLYDCVEKFMTRERLTANNEWYCPACKQHNQALKKIDLWMLPELLVVHLKRFRYKANSHFVSRDKIGDFVEYPVRGLDLRDYILPESYGSAVGQGPPPIYDLYGVSQHYGSIRGGHYTAEAKNFLEGKWFGFDDSRTSTLPSVQPSDSGK
eukprot:g4065.t1